MTQRANQNVQFTVGEKTYSLRFSIKALGILQDLWKLEDLDQVMAEVRVRVSRDNGALVDFILACMSRFHPEIRREEVDMLIDDLGIYETMQVVRDTINSAIPAHLRVQAEEESQDPQSPQPSTT